MNPFSIQLEIAETNVLVRLKHVLVFSILVLSFFNQAAFPGDLTRMYILDHMF